MMEMIKQQVAIHKLLQRNFDTHTAASKAISPLIAKDAFKQISPSINSQTQNGAKVKKETNLLRSHSNSQHDFNEISSQTEQSDASAFLINKLQLPLLFVKVK